MMLKLRYAYLMIKLRLKRNNSILGRNKETRNLQERIEKKIEKGMDKLKRKNPEESKNLEKKLKGILERHKLRVLEDSL